MKSGLLGPVLACPDSSTGQQGQTPALEPPIGLEQGSRGSPTPACSSPATPPLQHRPPSHSGGQGTAIRPPGIPSPRRLLGAPADSPES
jgi:hypothetical protein